MLLIDSCEEPRKKPVFHLSLWFGAGLYIFHHDLFFFLFFSFFLPFSFRRKSKPITLSRPRFPTHLADYRSENSVLSEVSSPRCLHGLTLRELCSWRSVKLWLHHLHARDPAPLRPRARVLVLGRAMSSTGNYSVFSPELGCFMVQSPFRRRRLNSVLNKKKN